MKINFKLFLIIAFVLVGVFSLFFNSNAKVLAQAQNEIIVNTTGYSVLSPSSFIFGGYYSGNLDKKGFTTYFEFKKNDPNLDVDTEETIKIERNTNVEESGDFYSSPELSLFSDYFFRAVGYFNDNSSQKFYGSVLNLRTGYIPLGATIPIPFTVGRGGVFSPYISPFCVLPLILNTSTNTCDNPPITCTPPEVYSFKKFACVNFSLPICTPQQFYDFLSNTCINRCISTKVYNILTNKCDNPSPPICTSTQKLVNGICKDKTGTGSGGADSDSGLVKCGISDASGKIANPCGFNDILTLINTIVNFIIVYLVVPLAAIMFAYAGFELITSGGETSKREKAKKIFTNVAIGIIIILAAFLIVKTVLSIVGYDQSWNWFGF